MKMKPVAVLTAGLLATPAFAQSNVTIYGRADYGLMSRSGDSGTTDFNGKTEFASGIAGPSRIGFRGSEEIGDGLKAIFEIEYGTAIDQGTTTSVQWGNRHSWVGLSGNFGTLIGGRIDGLVRLTDTYLALVSGTTGIFAVEGVTQVGGAVGDGQLLVAGVHSDGATSARLAGLTTLTNRGQIWLLAIEGDAALEETLLCQDRRAAFQNLRSAVPAIGAFEEARN